MNQQYIVAKSSNFRITKLLLVICGITSAFLFAADASYYGDQLEIDGAVAAIALGLFDLVAIGILVANKTVILQPDKIEIRYFGGVWTKTYSRSNISHFAIRKRKLRYNPIELFYIIVDGKRIYVLSSVLAGYYDFIKPLKSKLKIHEATMETFIKQGRQKRQLAFLVLALGFGFLAWHQYSSRNIITSSDLEQVEWKLANQEYTAEEPLELLLGFDDFPNAQFKVSNGPLQRIQRYKMQSRIYVGEILKLTLSKEDLKQLNKAAESVDAEQPILIYGLAIDDVKLFAPKAIEKEQKEKHPWSLILSFTSISIVFWVLLFWKKPTTARIKVKGDKK